MEAKKILFLLVVLLCGLFPQVFFFEYFFLWGVLILVFLSLESREVLFFLISSLILDIASSLPFGFFFILSLAIFVFSNFIFNVVLREWRLFIFGIWFLLWEILYILAYILFSKINFNFVFIFKNVLISEIFALLIFMFFQKIKKFLLANNLITTEKNFKIEF